MDVFKISLRYKFIRKAIKVLFLYLLGISTAVKSDMDSNLASE